jgi:cell division initiation protein
MIAPHELKNKEFPKSFRGYSTAEVDEHIAFLIEKYTELYRLNDELEKKLRLTEAKLEAIQADEEAIRATLVNAQKAGNRIISEANERADVIMRSAKSGCDRILAELKVQIKVENQRFRDVQREIAAFKAALFDAYQTHISQIETIAPAVEIKPYDEMDAETLSKEVLSRIRKDLSGMKPLISGTEDPFAEFEEEELPEEEEGNFEMPIPDTVDDEDEGDDEPNFTAARDVEAIFDDADEPPVIPTTRKRVPESGSSILASLKRINETADAMGDDDAEFLRMLKDVSAESDRADASTVDGLEIFRD